ncbi:glycosyltransferase family A protein [Roseateles sp.]|uniref:glycosyltransferase family A protein n=1 Tax=Roseateles sp. TaxID=1971397 RepID=UPI003BA87260
MFTIFTPTFNRAHTLGRVYASLCAQTLQDFEWLVVDDGSTDNTANLLEAWKQQGLIQLRYSVQANGGKHRAFNRGVREAAGEFFLTLDSDDSCDPDTLLALNDTWKAIPAELRDDFSGVSCLCRSESGIVLEGALPHSHIDGHPFAVLAELGRTAEMWGFHRTEILKSHPFPEFQGERFCPEGLIWNRLARRYQSRFINRALRVYHDTKDNLSSRATFLRHQSPLGTSLYYAEMLLLPLPLILRLRAAMNYWRFTRTRWPLPTHPPRAILWASAVLGRLLRIRDSLTTG